MLIHHMYVWDEAIAPEDESSGSNVRLRRLTIDILLPGPTQLSQIRAMISQDGKQLNFTYRPPQTFLNPNRTTVRIAQGVLGSAAADNAHIRQTMNAAAHVQAHWNALEQLRVESENNIITIDLPFECDCHFCRRDVITRTMVLRLVCIIMKMPVFESKTSTCGFFILSCQPVNVAGLIFLTHKYCM